MAQMIKNPLQMRETCVQSLGWEDLLEKGMATHSSILAMENSMDRGAWRVAVHSIAELDTNWSDLAAAAAITIRKTFRIESRAWWLLESEEWKKGRNLESHHMIDYWQTIESTMVGKINQAPSLTNIKSDEDEKQLNTYLKWSEISVMVVECLSDCFLSVC